MCGEQDRLCYRGISVRHGGLGRNRATLLFLHGLGDSGRAFDEAFSVEGLGDFNLVIPDMPGHGASADFPGGYSNFGDYVALLCDLLATLEIGPLLVIAHSMGGPIGVELCVSESAERARGLISIEGNLTVKDLFISGKAVAADERGEFDSWFRVKFVQETVGCKWAPRDRASRRYYEALRLCRPEAFLHNSRELVQRSQPSVKHPHGEIAAAYLALLLPKLYCLGEGCPAETRALLEEHREEWRLFPGAAHAVMIDAADALYAEVQTRARRLLGS